jgi:MoxR-like ATPase
MEINSSGNQAGTRVLDMVANAIIGKDVEIQHVFLAILARGHILLEDLPGVGQTTLALAFPKALSLDYNRIQFTPDVLPSDVTGFSVFNKDTGKMVYTPGAILCNLFLADELNRATSRTQSALLESMDEGQVTVDGVSHALPQPFIVIATQNPVGAAGTQMLPDSQIDRFMIRLSLGYPDHNDEVMILKRKQSASLLDNVLPVLDAGELDKMRSEVDQVHIHSDLYEYIVKLVSATRKHPDVLVGASPRASIALSGISKAMAYMQGRDYVLPKDIAQLLSVTITHRLKMRPGAETGKHTAEAALYSIYKSVRAPRIS